MPPLTEYLVRPSASSLLAVLAVIGCLCVSQHVLKSPPKRTATVLKITSEKGAVLPQFYRGLPVNNRFIDGKNGFSSTSQCNSHPSLIVALLQSSQRFLGLTFTTHAQINCNGCYQTLYETICGQYCDGGTYKATSGNGTCTVGFYNSGTQGCGNCYVPVDSLCSSGNCSCM